MKHHFRYVLVNYLLKIMETGKDVMKCTLLDAIRTTAVLWERIIPEITVACFRHAGLCSDPISAEEDH